MSQIKRFSYILFFAASALFLSSPLSAGPCTVSQGIPFSGDDIAREVAAAGGAPEGAEILVYGYTPVTESYILMKDESLSVNTHPAELRALVKIMQGGRLIKAEFVSGTGLDERTLIVSLASSIARLRAE